MVLLSSKICFCSQGIFDTLKLSQTKKIINLWHGMPLKAIEYFDKVADSTRADITIATSDYYKDIMARSFRIDKDILLQKLIILITLIIHPADFLQTIDFPVYKNIIVLKYLNSNVQLYPLLGNTDFLLTDYSSVWIDYDILNKPIGFVMNDIEEYRNDRGLMFDDLEKQLPGSILSNTNQLFDFISNLDNAVYKDTNTFNKYKDKNASARLLFMLNL